MVRDNVRKFARERFLPGVSEWYIDERYPDELTPELGQLGVFGANLTGYGCTGMDSASYGLIMRELNTSIVD